MQWELTATFQGIFEHSRKRERRVSIKSGTKISFENVSSYDSIMFANNLALVKLKCHDINVSVDFTKTNCSIPMDCSTQNQSGYLHSSKKRLRYYRELSQEINAEGNVTLLHCSIGLGMDTIYFCADQPVAVSHDKMNECVKRQRIPATPICYYIEWITSIMQGKSVC